MTTRVRVLSGTACTLFSSGRGRDENTSKICLNIDMFDLRMRVDAPLQASPVLEASGALPARMRPAAGMHHVGAARRFVRTIPFSLQDPFEVAQAAASPISCASSRGPIVEGLCPQSREQSAIASPQVTLAALLHWCKLWRTIPNVNRKA
jgi:hypothetical protein